MKLVEQVSQFVAKQTGFPLRDISSETSLAHDIGLAGDDSEKFFAAFAKQFDVDLDSLRHMDFKKHFAHEGEFMWSGLVVAVAILLTLIVGSAFGLSIWLSGPLFSAKQQDPTRPRLSAARHASCSRRSKPGPAATPSNSAT